MTFETFVGALLSIFLPKFIENSLGRENVRFSVIRRLIITAVVFGLMINIEWIVRAVANEEIIALYDQMTSSIFFSKSIDWTVANSDIYFAYKNDFRGNGSFKALEKVIKNFTAQVSDNDVLYIFCGDMDVWGCNENDSAELKQLIELQNSYKNLDIRILCKHCMEDTLIEEILNDNYDEDAILTETRLNQEQVERIAYFKENLKSCSFRFYKKASDDYSNLRARVIKSHSTKKVLTYRDRIVPQSGLRKWFHCSEEGRKHHIYEYNEINNPDDYQLLHYVELCELKWKNCNSVLANKIEEYCIRYSKAKRGEKNSVKKIAFVYAKTYEIAHFGKARKEFPPFGVMYLAAMVREYCNEWLADIIAIEDTDTSINANLYDVIAFSVVSAYTVPIFEKCMKNIQAQLKNQSDTVCIAGGFQAELEGEKWLKSKLVRLIMCGEGENNIVKLLNEGYNKKTTYNEIPGAMFWGLVNGKPKLITKQKNQKCVDLNQLPKPARDMLPEEDYIMNNRLADTNYKMVHVLFSRGCSYNCAYCGVRREGNRTVRYRSVENIIDELLYLKNRDIEGFSIIDDCFLTNKEKALEIIRAITTVDMKWSLAARVDQIDEETVKALSDSGCLEIKLGLETGSDKILKAMRKGFTVAEAKKAILLIKKYNIGVKAFMITGLPGETKDTNKETIEFLKEMGKENINRISLLRFVPLPGSYIFENPKDFGIRKDIKTIDYKCYRLYNEEVDWWEKKSDFEDRNLFYKELSEFMLTIWDTI